MENQNNLQTIRIILHAFFLIALNLFSLIAGVIITLLIGGFKHEVFQSGSAFVFNAIMYFLVFKFMAGIQKEVMHIDNFFMVIIMLISSVVLFPLVFIPLQYMISGNWQSVGAATNVWPFLLVTNGLCLSVNYFFSDSNFQEL